MKTQNLTLLTLSILIGLFAGCKKDKDDEGTPAPPPNEEELITSLYLQFVPLTGGDTLLLSFVDMDGPGGNAPVIIGDTLSTGTMYQAFIVLLNESVSPADTISNEVAAEAEEHQFFFSTSGGVLAWTGYADADADGNPLGLITDWSTGAATGPGTITVTLRHQPDKSAPGVAGGDITNAGGETDIEVALPVVVE